MKLFEETSRQCVSATIGENSSGYYQKIDRTLEYFRSAWLDGMIVVTCGSKQKHEPKLFDVQSKLEQFGFRARKSKFEFFQKQSGWAMKLMKTELNRIKRKSKRH